MSEKINIPKFEQETNETEIDRGPRASALERSAELPDQKSPEKLSNNKEVESAKNEALELAHSKELKPDAEQAERDKSEKQPSKPTRADLNANFERTMTGIRKDMTPASRTLSKVIHNPTVDKISNVVGNTVARPNLILAGALGTLVVCTVIYLVAKFYGYKLSGSEAIVTFALGWMVGAIVEFARVGMSSKQN